MGGAVLLVAILAALQMFGGSVPTGVANDQARSVKSLNGCALKPGTQCARTDLRYGLRDSKLRVREHGPDARSHTSQGTNAPDYEYPIASREH